MQQFLVQIENESHVQDFISYMKSIGEVDIHQIKDDGIQFSEKEKNILNERRLTAKEEDYIPWDDAMKSIKY